LPIPSQTSELEPLIEEFEASIRSRRRTEHHVFTTLRQIREFVSAAGFTTLQSISADATNAAIEKLVRDKRLLHRTANQYVTSIKSFTRWLVETRDSLPRDPLRNLKKLKVDNHKIQRRALTWLEVEKLFASIQQKNVARYRIAPLDRIALYQAALGTGCSAAVLARLVAGQFHFDASPPILQLSGKQATEGASPQIVFFVDELRRYIETKSPEALALHSPKHGCDWIKILRPDLKDAGIEPYRYDPDTGAHNDQVDFQSLRITHVNWLFKLGWDPRDIQLQAGHASIEATMEYWDKQRDKNLLLGYQATLESAPARRGRPQGSLNSDPEFDRRISEAVARTKSRAAVAAELGIDALKVKEAQDRHRKRQKNLAELNYSFNSAAEN
jgi:integrase